ncbi:DUF4446 family protein [Candidatus Roizmanbacteria bacterium]|nr:DUF4446 family protein [Candidatus Roizmanbacteria bacterium]
MVTLQYGLYVIFGLWLVTVSYFLWRTRSHYQRLAGHTQAGSLEKILNSIVDIQEINKNDILTIKKELLTQRDDSRTHFQKMGFMRFSPFGRGGGEQSFVMALLNDHDDGVILNFLYTHDGVRVYPKQIKHGEGDGCTLSVEELSVIKKSSRFQE